MKRADLLVLLKFAGYHGDQAGWTRLVVENRIRITVAGQAYSRGIESRKSGVACGCTDCKAVA